MALAARHGHLQKDGMKTDRQGLHLPASLPLADHVPASAARAHVELLRRFYGDKDASVFHHRPGRTVALRDPKYLMQYSFVHRPYSSAISLAKYKLSG
jgi:hypothetical protein